MYIPILKNRMYEVKLLKEFSHLFNDATTPLLELIHLKPKKGVEDPFKHRLLEYQSIIEKEFFVEFYQYNDKKHKNADHSKINISYDIYQNDNEENYIINLYRKLKEINLAIPVVTVSNINLHRDYARIIKFVKKHFKTVVLRFKLNALNDTIKECLNMLRENDTVFVDIDEESVLSTKRKIKKINLSDYKFKKILTYSARKKSQTYSELSTGQTKIIDEEPILCYKKLGFDGIANYLGIKDDLPAKGGNTSGENPTAILFDYKANAYKIEQSEDLKGAEGFKSIMKTLMKKDGWTNDNNDCDCYKEMLIREKNDKYKTFGTFKFFTIIRYLSQMKRYHNTN